MRKTLRYLEEKLFKILMYISSFIIAGCLLLIISTIIVKGYNAFNLDMITKIPGGGFYIGKEGGILNAIIGSLYIAGGASVIGLLISIPIVIYINLHIGDKSLLGNIIRLGYDIMFGIPSIIYGVFGFTIIVFLGMKTSLLGGLIAVTFLVVPIMVCTLNELIRTVPSELSDTLYSLGTTKLETARVIIKQIMPGVVTAFLLAFTRGIGDAAAVLFTAGYSDNIPTSLNQPAATLPLAIFFQLGSPIQEVQDRAYSAALLLTVIVLVISIASRIISKKLSKHSIK